MGTLSNPELINLYHKLNQDLFDGALPDIPCIWNTRLRRSFGRTFVQRKSKRMKWSVSKIDLQSGLTGEVLRKTMVHEMCHVWCCIHHQQMGHTKDFWKKMADCGYPDGHKISDSERQDKWQLTKGTSFSIGQSVSFNHPKLGTVLGTVLRVNRRTITIISDEGADRWRVSPSMVAIVLK